MYQILSCNLCLLFWFLENYPLDIIKSNVGGSTVRMDLSLTLRCQVPGVLEAIWNLRYSPESAVLCILLCCVVQTPDPLGRSRTVLTIPGFSRLLASWSPSIGYTRRKGNPKVPSQSAFLSLQSLAFVLHIKHLRVLVVHSGRNREKYIHPIFPEVEISPSFIFDLT